MSDPITSTPTEIPQNPNDIAVDLRNPDNKVKHLYGLNDANASQLLWYYKGNNKNWLYTPYQTTLINQNFTRNQQNVQSNSDSEVSEELEVSDNFELFQIDVIIGQETKTYVIDLNNMVQYPLGSPNNRRSIDFFNYDSDSLKRYKIVGISGQYF